LLPDIAPFDNSMMNEVVVRYGLATRLTTKLVVHRFPSLLSLMGGEGGRKKG